MKMKSLLLLQAAGILAFIILSVLLRLFGLFGLASSIILYTTLSLIGVTIARFWLIKPIEEVSYYDKLTGCYNRAMLEQKKKEYENYSKYTIIFFDVNNLKKMNDIHGHDDGDKLLVNASKQLKFWRKYGDLYRIGGDEFIVVIPNQKQTPLKLVIEQWASRQTPLNEGYGDDFVCSFSYGMFNKKPDMSFEDIMEKADEEMYKMKQELKVQRKE